MLQNHFSREAQSRKKRTIMRLVTFQTKLTDTTPRLGAWIDDDQIVDLTAVAPDMSQFFEQNCLADAQAYIERTDLSDVAFLVADVQLLAPFPRPASLRDFGVFKTHMDAAARITGKEISPEWFKLPNYYRGSTSPSSIAGHEALVTWPNYTQKLDFELEWGRLYRQNREKYLRRRSLRVHRRLHDLQRHQCSRYSIPAHDPGTRSRERERF